MADPTLCGQPKHMSDYRTATPPYTYDRNDYGWVHDNSGIHNYAAYRVMTAKSGSKYLFKRKDIAAMFYIALTVQLSRTSQFARQPARGAAGGAVALSQRQRHRAEPEESRR